MKEKRIVAYKVWKCRFCEQARQESSDMWRHLQDEHGIGSVENNSEVMMDNEPAD